MNLATSKVRSVLSKVLWHPRILALMMLAGAAIARAQTSDAEPENYKFGGGADQSILHPLVLVAMVVVVVLIFVQQRRKLIAPFLLSAFLIPMGQQFLLGGVHVYVFRIIVLAGLIRVALRRPEGSEGRIGGGWNSIDTVFTLFVILHTLAFSLLYKDSAAVINQCGLIWDQLGAYLFLRYAIADEDDVRKGIKTLAVLAFIFAVTMINESFTGINIFGRLGGVRLVSEMREGHVRAQSAFQHAILAGTYAGTLLPLFVSLWIRARSKFLSLVGVVSATIMTVTTWCSTPMLAFAASVGAMCAWPFRKRMLWFRLGVVGCIIGLTLVMNAPIWFFISHIGVIEGSSANHRAELMATFMNHIGDWWLMGTDKNGTWGFLMFDTSNEYVHQGVTGGLGTLLCLIATISLAFRRVGKARAAVEAQDRSKAWLLWLLGCSVFATMIAFFGISYFDQMRVAWLTLLAMISAATARRDKLATEERASLSEEATLETEQFAYSKFGYS